MVVKERIGEAGWTPPWVRRQHLARYRWAARMVTGLKVLDAASGTGYGSRILLRGGAAMVVAADMELDALLLARASAPAVAVDVTRLPFPNEAFEAYVCLETLEHVRDDGACLDEARRVIRADGLFICSTPNRLIMNPGRSLRDRPFNRFHVREYAPDEFESLLDSRFNEVRLYGQSCYGAVYARTLATVGRIVPDLAFRVHQIRKLLLLPLDRETRHLPGPFPANGLPEMLIAVCR